MDGYPPRFPRGLHDPARTMHRRTLLGALLVSLLALGGGARIAWGPSTRVPC